MFAPWRWLDAALAASERLPLVARLKGGARRGLAIGALWVGVLLLLVGAGCGALNRGWAGLLVGGISGGLGGAALGGALGATLGRNYFYHSDSAVVTIRLDGAGGPYRAGDVVRGHLLVAAHRTLRLEGGEITLTCRGTRAWDELVLDDEQPHMCSDTISYLVRSASTLPNRTIGRDTAIRYPFEFALPEDALPSHYGAVYAIDWTIRAHLNTTQMPRLEAQHEVMVMARPPRVPHYTGGYRALVSSEVAQLVLSMDRILYTPGDALHAALRVVPRQSFPVDEIRALLLRIETVPVGDDHIVYVAAVDADSGVIRGERRPGGSGTTYVWLESEVDLTDRQVIRASEALTYEFCLEVPPAWRPTLDGPDGQVLWKLGILIARPGQDSLRIFHEVIVHTFVAAPRGAAAAEGTAPARVRRVTAPREPRRPAPASGAREEQHPAF